MEIFKTQEKGWGESRFLFRLLLPLEETSPDFLGSAFIFFLQVSEPTKSFPPTDSSPSTLEFVPSHLLPFQFPKLTLSPLSFLRPLRNSSAQSKQTLEESSTIKSEGRTSSILVRTRFPSLLRVDLLRPLTFPHSLSILPDFSQTKAMAQEFQPKKVKKEKKGKKGRKKVVQEEEEEDLGAKWTGELNATLDFETSRQDTC